MGLFLCDKCNEQLPFSADHIHVCDSRKIRDYVDRLRREKHEAENKLDDIKNGVFMILQSLPELTGEDTTVKTEWLRKLWQAADCCWWEAKSADSFLSRWLVTHRVLCEAFDLFRSKKYGKVEPLLEKLIVLHEACLQARKTLGYDSDMDMTPEDLLNENRSQST